MKITISKQQCLVNQENRTGAGFPGADRLEPMMLS